MSDFKLAVSQLTALPLQAEWPGGGEVPDVAGWYPLVGLGVGAAVYATIGGSGAIGLPSLVAGVLGVVVGAVLTGGLHWDGLADVADAWCASGQVRRHEILKDSATGAFGTLAVVLAVVLQASALSALSGSRALSLVVLVGALSRMAATFSAWLGTPARRTGLGASIARRPGVSAVLGFVVALVVMGAVSAALLPHVGPARIALTVLVGVVSALVVPHLVAGRFGGVTGDTMGASVVIVESVMLVVGTGVFA